ncbi:MAG: hypothetical protein M1833_006899 [Piccolia ochrophora]|nr:MAG: hypothetical protein M1833_006899 [Piccolia ochrophora]
MVHKRPLPQAHNPLLATKTSPPYDDLIERRRLGQTDLHVKGGAVGKVNATKPENLGMFDYAHLRAPLPHDLSGSEIFAAGPHQNPDSYFLMRRSSDGYISATGMFKASFPWAAMAEEDAERKYIKGLPTTSHDETAGNVWIPPSAALDLAEEYKIGIWIKALLDPSPIDRSQDSKKSISPPPKFVLPKDHSLILPPPSSTPTPGRGRGRPRSSSPGKHGSPTKKTASARKKPTKAANAANASAANATLQNALNSVVNAAEAKAEEGTDNVKVEVDSSVEVNGDVETNHTQVKVELPGHAPELPLPEKTEDMINTAKEMVKEAQALDKSTPKGSRKRKAETADEDDESQRPKRTKVLEEQLKKEKVKTKALIGLSVSLAVGAVLPYVL